MEKSSQIVEQDAPVPVAMKVTLEEASPVNTSRLRLLVFLSVIALLIIALFPVVSFRLAFLSSGFENPFHDQAVDGSLSTTPPQQAVASASSEPISERAAGLGLVDRLVRASRTPLSTAATAVSTSTTTTKADVASAVPAAAGSSDVSRESSRIGRPLRAHARSVPQPQAPQAH